MLLAASKFRDFDTNFQEFAENRSSGFCTQFVQIFKRNLRYMTRNKQALAGIVFNATFITLLLLAVYYQLGQWGAIGFAADLSAGDLAAAQKTYAQYVQNMTGLAFLLSN